MNLLVMIKHSVELVVALVVCYIGAVMFSPGAVAVAKAFATDYEPSVYSGHYYLRPSYSCYGSTMIRPSSCSFRSFRCR